MQLLVSTYQQLQLWSWVSTAFSNRLCVYQQQKRQTVCLHNWRSNKTVEEVLASQRSAPARENKKRECTTSFTPEIRAISCGKRQGAEGWSPQLFKHNHVWIWRNVQLIYYAIKTRYMVYMEETYHSQWKYSQPLHFLIGRHSVYNSLQFFQWLVMFQCSGQSYGSSVCQTIVSEAAVIRHEHTWVWSH